MLASTHTLTNTLIKHTSTWPHILHVHVVESRRTEAGGAHAAEVAGNSIANPAAFPFGLSPSSSDNEEVDARSAGFARLLLPCDFR